MNNFIERIQFRFFTAFLFRSCSSLLLCILLTTSCNLFSQKEQEDDKEVVAKAYNYKLYKDDLAGVVPRGASNQDSLKIIKGFIDNWVRQKVVLYKAEQNLDDEKKNVEKKLEEYRNSLVNYAYETELIRQQLDTVVNEEEIQAYYTQNKNNFELKDNIIKVLYLKVNKNSPKLNKVREWYKSSNPKDRQLLTDYCHQYALNFYLDDSIWLLFDDLLKEIPIKTYDKEQFLQNNRNIEIEDSSAIYLVSIRGFMIKNSISPISFERNNIRALIVNQRKLNLISKMEQQAYDDALKNGKIELF